MNNLKKTFHWLDIFMKMGGIVANILLLLLFTYGTWKLASLSQETYSSLPVMPSYSLQEWATVIVDQENWGWFLETGQNLCKLWILMVMTIGFGWMTLLGGRWLYRIVLHITGRIGR